MAGVAGTPCLVGDGCSCEGRTRPDWPMPDSPPSFWPRQYHYPPDRFVEENLRMATARIPVE